MIYTSIYVYMHMGFLFLIRCHSLLRASLGSAAYRDMLNCLHQGNLRSTANRAALAIGVGVARDSCS